MPDASEPQAFASFDGLRLAYYDEGEGDCVVLLHGFASDSASNWRETGIFGALVGAGRRVVALDARGHGRSDKPHEPVAYEDDAMARDVSALLDQLGIAECDVVGYSMGSHTALQLVLADARVRSLVLGGVGDGRHNALTRSAEERVAIADALETSDPEAVTDAAGRGFRAFADAVGADRAALAAIMRADRKRQVYEELASVTVPVLVMAGDEDTLAGSPQDLATRIPGARAVTLSGSHVGAVRDPVLLSQVAEFLAGRSGR